eukprot:UN21232
MNFIFCNLKTSRKMNFIFLQTKTLQKLLLEIVLNTTKLHKMHHITFLQKHTPTIIQP